METQFSLLDKGGSPPQFSAHFCCAQTAGCIKMPLGLEVGLSPGQFVLDGDQPPPQRVEVENFEIGPEIGGTSGYS